MHLFLKNMCKRLYTDKNIEIIENVSGQFLYILICILTFQNKKLSKKNKKKLKKSIYS